MTSSSPLRVAWFSFFPIERLTEVPAEIASLPSIHPAPWQRVLVEELSEKPEVELHVIALRKELARDLTFTRRNVTYHALRVKRGLRAPTLFWLDTWLIRRRLRAIRPHLIHAWGSEQGAALIASRLPYPALVTVQGLMNWIAERVPVNPYERLGAFVERRALRRARFATTESRFAVEYLQHHYPQLRVLQIEHAPNRIFESVIRKPDTATVRFLFVGAFSQLKGLDLLATALDRLRQSFDFQVTLVGGPRSGFLDHVRQQTSPALWNQVEIKENLSSEEVAAEMARATALLFPTRVDTSPNAVKEAVVAGLPVAASAIGGIVDYVIPGRNGITFEAGSAEGLRVAIQKVLEHSTFRSGRVDPSTLAEMRAYLSPTRMAASFLEAYRQVAG